MTSDFGFAPVWLVRTYKGGVFLNGEWEGPSQGYISGAELMRAGLTADDIDIMTRDAQFKGCIVARDPTRDGVIVKKANQK
jgi:hypothetical protein